MTLLFDESQDLFSEYPVLTLYFKVLMITTMIGFPIISLILFPFYVKVNRKNRKRDQETPVFPITDYFYKTTFLTESSIFLGCLMYPFTFLISKNSQFKSAPRLFLQLYWTPVSFFMINVTMLINILIALLAFQRFFLYFFPNLELSVPKWVVTCSILVLHIPIFFIIVLALYAPEYSSEEQKNLDRIMQISQFSLNGIVILSTFLYFIMITSIRKLTHISNIQSKPEMYIRCQIMIILFSKLLIIPFLVIMKRIELVSPMGAPMFVAQLICESLITPLMIQTAYLLSNKTNLDTLRHSFGVLGRIRKMLKRKDSRVEPVQEITILTNDRGFENV